MSLGQASGESKVRLEDALRERIGRVKAGAAVLLVCGRKINRWRVGGPSRVS